MFKFVVLNKFFTTQLKRDMKQEQSTEEEQRSRGQVRDLMRILANLQSLQDEVQAFTADNPKLIMNSMPLANTLSSIKSHSNSDVELLKTFLIKEAKVDKRSVKKTLEITRNNALILQVLQGAAALMTTRDNERYLAKCHNLALDYLPRSMRNELGKIYQTDQKPE